MLPEPLGGIQHHDGQSARFHVTLYWAALDFCTAFCFGVGIFGDMLLRKAIFFDRDGVLNVNHGHVHLKENFDWVDGAQDAIRKANELGYVVIVVTNQAGIAKGYYSKEVFHTLMRWVDEQLAKTGAHIDGIYYCPHHPEGVNEFKSICKCRKPAPGMLLQAITEHNLDPEASWLIGDSLTDIEASNAAGVRGILFDGGNVFEALQSAGAF